MTEEEKAKLKDTEEAPKSEGEVKEPFDRAEVLERLDTLERDQKHFVKLVNFVQGTNNLVIIVLFVGFVTLFVGLAALIVEAIKGGGDKTPTTQIIIPTNAPTPIVVTLSPSSSPSK